MNPSDPRPKVHERTLIMGVLNTTPDSFSDGGRFSAPDIAIRRAEHLMELGADLIDVGGESTRPGATAVGSEEELRRVLPVVKALATAGIPVSVDTMHAETAQAVVAAGARWINDVSGGLHDPAMLAAAAWASAEHGARYIAGHWRGIPDPEHSRSEYTDVVPVVRDALRRLASAAIEAGVAPEHLVIDPGLGFDKNGPQCWQLLERLDELTAIGFPVLVGASRKRMIADALEVVPAAARTAQTLQSAAHERDLATSVVSALSARAGAWGVRVHDVAGSAHALAVVRAWDAGGRETKQRSALRSKTDDRITLTGLEVFAHHGVFEFERERGQRFVIDAEVAVDLAAAAAGDAIERTVHYGELAAAIATAVERDPVDLIETVAERIADVALGFEGVREATITVHKPDAPIQATFSDVSVTVVRSARGSRR